MCRENKAESESVDELVEKGQMNIWPKGSECGVSRGTWNWYSSSRADPQTAPRIAPFARALAWVEGCTNSNFLCYNSSQSMDRCSASRQPADGFWRFFMLSIYCPFRAEKWLYSVERVEAGETVDSKSRQ
jgi:hypothetical protein